MKVREIMTPDVEVAFPDDSLQTAAGLMRDNETGVLPVCESGRLVGMITDRDITIRAVAEGKSPSDCMVREMMTEEVHYAFAGDEVDGVARKMAEWQYTGCRFSAAKGSSSASSRSATLRSKAKTRKAPLEPCTGLLDRARSTSLLGE
jgi:CBS domain-containing protein